MAARFVFRIHAVQLMSERRISEQDVREILLRFSGSSSRAEASAAKRTALAGCIQTKTLA